MVEKQCAILEWKVGVSALTGFNECQIKYLIRMTKRGVYLTPSNHRPLSTAGRRDTLFKHGEITKRTSFQFLAWVD